MGIVPLVYNITDCQPFLQKPLNITKFLLTTASILSLFFLLIGAFFQFLRKKSTKIFVLAYRHCFKCYVKVLSKDEKDIFIAAYMFAEKVLPNIMIYKQAKLIPTLGSVT
jgi:predicted permease